MNQKSLIWDDITPNSDKTYTVKKVDPKQKKARKYKNTVKIINGVKYDSILEAYMRPLLDLHKIKYQFKPSWVLQEEFIYLGKKIKEIRLEPDYPIENEIGELIALLDTKGMKTPDWKLKIKILKHNWFLEGRNIPILLPKDRSECHKAIITIKKLLNEWK